MSITTGTILKIVASLIWNDGEIAQNVFNAVVTGGGGPWDVDDIVQDAVSWAEEMYDNMAGQMSDEIDGSQVQVYEYDSIDDDWDEVGSSVWVYNPTGASGQLPRGVAMLINLKTTDPDVSGKKYLPACTAGNVADGLLTGAAITAITAFAVDWLTGFVGTDSAADWAPGIWSPTDTVFKLATGLATIPTICAYQRRRKRGIGI